MAMRPASFFFGRERLTDVMVFLFYLKKILSAAEDKFVFLFIKHFF